MSSWSLNGQGGPGALGAWAQGPENREIELLVCTGYRTMNETAERTMNEPAKNNE